MTKDIDGADRLVVGCLAVPGVVALLWGVGALVLWAVGVAPAWTSLAVVALCVAVGVVAAVVLCLLLVLAGTVGEWLLDDAAIARALAPLLRRTRRVTRRG